MGCLPRGANENRANESGRRSDRRSHLTVCRSGGLGCLGSVDGSAGLYSSGAQCSVLYMNDIHDLLISLLQVREILLAPIRSMLNEFSLTEQQWRIVLVLAQEDVAGIRPGQIAKQCCILDPSLTGILRRLERDGVVMREISNVDSRAQLIKLTAYGERLFLTIKSRMEARYRLIEEVYGCENLQNISSALRGLREQGIRGARIV